MDKNGGAGRCGRGCGLGRSKLDKLTTHVPQSRCLLTLAAKKEPNKRIHVKKKTSTITISIAGYKNLFKVSNICIKTMKLYAAKKIN